MIIGVREIFIFIAIGEPAIDRSARLSSSVKLEPQGKEGVSHKKVFKKNAQTSLNPSLGEPYF